MGPLTLRFTWVSWVQKDRSFEKLCETWNSKLEWNLTINDTGITKHLYHANPLIFERVVLLNIWAWWARKRYHIHLFHTYFEWDSQLDIVNRDPISQKGKDQAAYLQNLLSLKCPGIVAQRAFWPQIYFTQLFSRVGGQVGCIKEQNSSRNSILQVSAAVFLPKLNNFQKFQNWAQ